MWPIIPFVIPMLHVFGMLLSSDQFPTILNLL